MPLELIKPRIKTFRDETKKTKNKHIKNRLDDSDSDEDRKPSLLSIKNELESRNDGVFQSQIPKNMRENMGGRKLRDQFSRLKASVLINRQTELQDKINQMQNEKAFLARPREGQDYSPESKARRAHIQRIIDDVKLSRK